MNSKRDSETGKSAIDAVFKQMITTFSKGGKSAEVAMAKRITPEYRRESDRHWIIVSGTSLL